MPHAPWLDREAYPFDSRWLVVGAGARMHYVDEGRGDPILFVHGTPSWSFEWRHLISGLCHDYRCVAPDLVGFGLSSRPRDFASTPPARAGAPRAPAAPRPGPPAPARGRALRGGARPERGGGGRAARSEARAKARMAWAR